MSRRASVTTRVAPILLATALVSRSAGAEERLYATDVAKLIKTPPSPSDLAATSVALRGDVAVLGVPGHDEGSAIDAGAAIVFVRSGAKWAQSSLLVAGDRRKSDELGRSVAIDGDVVVAAAPQLEGTIGAAYVFTRTGATWTQTAKLTPPAGSTPGRFGAAVAVHGDVVVVGDSLARVPLEPVGAAHVYVRSGSTWAYDATLVPSDGKGYDYFGSSIAIDGASIVIGAPTADAAAQPNAGAAYVFVRSGATWVQQAKLVHEGGSADENLGSHVAIAGDLVVSGAPGASPDSKIRRGAVYVHRRTGTKWVEGKPLVASDGSVEDRFGSSVATNGSIVLVGAPAAGVGGKSAAGAVYAYRELAGAWIEAAKLFASDGGAGEAFGGSVALDADVALVGAARATPSSLFAAGAAYVQRLVPTKANGASCTGAMECTSRFCVDGVCCNEACTASCVACSAAKKGSGADGTCGAIAAEIDPETPCPTGTRCVRGACEAAVARCSADGSNVIDATGKESPCTPRRCKGDRCVEVCATSDDCATGYVCATDRCEPAGAGSDDGGGCALGRSASPAAHVFLAVGLLSAAAAHRRRSRTRR